MVLDRDLVPQAAAVPMRAGRVCLISSRGGKRWVVPKGRLERGRGPEVIALQEAWEEAGLLGILLPKPLGTYRYEKDDLVHRVTVYQMDVVAEMDDWPEVCAGGGGGSASSARWSTSGTGGSAGSSGVSRSATTRRSWHRPGRRDSPAELGRTVRSVALNSLYRARPAGPARAGEGSRRPSAGRRGSGRRPSAGRRGSGRRPAGRSVRS